MKAGEDDVSAPDPLRVAQALAVLPDRRMRRARLKEIIVACTPSQAAWLLDTFATVGRAGGPPFDLSLLAAVDLATGDHLEVDQRRAIFEAADAHALLSCKELLLADGDLRDDEDARLRPAMPGARPLTLGERKALARSWRRDVLERLIADPHADVVELLLANPHVTERDILRIATSRRSSPGVLMLVLQARRWGPRPRLRRALVRNPNLPLAIALRLVGLLNRQEMRELAGDPGLPAPLAAALGRRLRPFS